MISMLLEINEAENNYHLIPEGSYDCTVLYVWPTSDEHRKIINFYIAYVQENELKPLIVKYVFTANNSLRTTGELIELLSSTFPITNEELSVLFNDKEKLIKFCTKLTGRRLKLYVDCSPKRNGQMYKSLRLKFK